MPFCTHCGSKYESGVLFCASCGFHLGDDVYKSETSMPPSLNNGTTYIDSSLQIRKETNEEIEKMCNYFLSVSNQYENYFRLCEKVDSDRRIHKVALMVLGIVFGIVPMIGSLLFLPLVLWDTIWDETEDIHIIMDYFLSNSDFRLFLVWFALAFTITLLFFVPFVIVNHNRKKRIPNEEKEKLSLWCDLWNHYKEYGQCLIGFEYTFPEALIEIKNHFSSGRVNTVMDAVNAIDLRRFQYRYKINIMARETAINVSEMGNHTGRRAR